MLIVSDEAVCSLFSFFFPFLLGLISFILLLSFVLVFNVSCIFTIYYALS